MFKIAVMASRPRLRILHAPTDVGNQPWGVSQAERELGMFSRTVVYQKIFQGFGADYDLRFRERPRLIRLMLAIKFFLFAIWKFDIFHFYFATTFFPGYFDLYILKILRKKMFFTFQGCDIRPARLCAPARLDPVKHRHATEDIQQKRLSTLLGFATKTYVLNPDLSPVSPTSEFLAYASVDISAFHPKYPFVSGQREIVIFHAPSDRLVKGTDHLEQAVTVLRREGFQIRLDLAHGVSHDEVLQRAGGADLVVDQLLGGWYGAFAVEAMALGKPVICYLEPRQLALVPYLQPIPIINASTATIVATLRTLLQTPDRWTELGKLSRAYVERVHDPKQIAAGLIADYRAA